MQTESDARVRAGLFLQATLRYEARVRARALVLGARAAARGALRPGPASVPAARLAETHPGDARTRLPFNQSLTKRPILR
jgi:hypothetical protein